MKTYTLISALGLLVGCGVDPSLSSLSFRGAKHPDQAAVADDDAGAPEPAEMKVAPGVAKAAPVEPAPAQDAGVGDAQVDSDADAQLAPDPHATPLTPTEPAPRMEPSGSPDADLGADAGMPGSEHPPSVTSGPSQAGSLRKLSVRLTGMDDDLHHFTQFRVSDSHGDFQIMFVIHEGLTSGTYAWELPNALLPGESYRLDFFIDHDESTGPGFYDRPPVDHAWSIPIPAGDGDVAIDFAYNEDFVDIEAIAPTPFHSTYLTSSGMSQYRGQLYDVRVIERSSGRLVGRQLREVPGDSFDLTVGSTTQEGVEYEIDVAVDADGNGHYNYPADPSWRLIATADADGLHPTLDASADQVDVGF